MDGKLGELGKGFRSGEEETWVLGLTFLLTGWVTLTLCLRVGSVGVGPSSSVVLRLC